MANIHVSFLKSIYGNNDLFHLAVFDSLNVIIVPYRKWEILHLSWWEFKKKSVYPEPSVE